MQLCRTKFRKFCILLAKNRIPSHSCLPHCMFRLGKWRRRSRLRAKGAASGTWSCGTVTRASRSGTIALWTYSVCISKHRWRLHDIRDSRKSGNRTPGRYNAWNEGTWRYLALGCSFQADTLSHRAAAPGSQAACLELVVVCRSSASRRSSATVKFEGVNSSSHAGRRRQACEHVPRPGAGDGGSGQWTVCAGFFTRPPPAS